MAETRLRIGKQLAKSASASSVMISDPSNEAQWFAPSTGADRLFFYDDSAGSVAWLNLGTNLSITGTTINASAGAGGYVTIQEEGSDLAAQTKLNFVGGGFTATNDAGNSRTNVTLDADLNALAALATTGIAVRTAADTWATRSIAGTASRIAVSNGDGVAGNPTIDIDAAYVGQTSITTLGTIGTGTWQGTAVGAIYGGTGQTAVATGDLLFGSATNVWSRRTIGSAGNFLRVSGGLPTWTTAASTDLSDSANIAMLNENETVSGSWTFSNVIVNNVTPTLGTHLVNKTYVDSLFQGVRDYKESVRVASTANVTVTYNSTGGTSARGQITAAPNTLNGVSLASGNRILLKNQSTGAQNGIWVVTTVGTGANGVWDRATDFDADAEVTSGATCYVSEFVTTDNRGTYVLTTSDPITIGGASGTALTFTQIDSPTGYQAGNGLTLTGLTFDVGTASSARIVVNADNIDLATTAVTPNPYGSATQVGTFTVDAYGRLTAAANVAISVTSTAITDFNEAAQDAVGTILTDSATIDFTYNDAGNTITAIVIDDSITFAKMQNIGTGTLIGRSTAATGDPESITVSSGLTISGGLLTHADTSSVANLDTTGAQIIDTLTFDTYGHVTAVTTRNIVLDDINDVVLTSATNGDVLQFNGTNWINTPMSTTVTWAYIEGSTATTIDLDANTGVVKDRNGNNIAFTTPSDLDKMEVYRNGILQARTGTGTTRDYSVNGGTHEITFVVALASDEVVLIKKFG